MAQRAGRVRPVIHEIAQLHDEAVGRGGEAKALRVAMHVAAPRAGIAWCGGTHAIVDPRNCAAMHPVQRPPRKADRRRIDFPQSTPASRNTSVVASQGAWTQRIGQVGEFRHKAAHIGALRIEFSSLQHRIEDAEIGRGIGPASRHPLPGSAIGRLGRPRTACPRTRPRPSCQGSSRCFIRKEAQIMRTRLCIQPVCHNSRMPASTMGMPVRPCCQACKTPRHPGARECLRIPRGSVHGADAQDVPEQIDGKFPPEQFLQEGSRPVAGPSLVYGMPQHARGDLAEMHMRRKHRGARQRRIIPRGIVILHRPGQEALQARLARLPRRGSRSVRNPCAQSGFGRQEIPIRQVPVAFYAFNGQNSARRGRSVRFGHAGLETGFSEGRVHAVQATGPGENTLRREQAEQE